MSKINPLEQPDPILNLLQNLSAELSDAMLKMGHYQTRKKVLLNELKDIETQEIVLDCLKEALEHLTERIKEREISVTSC
jgi:hypothetical protein